MVGGSFLMMRSPVESVTRQPMARADSMVSVMFSSMASSLSAMGIEGVMIVRARRSTVLRTDLLISLLYVVEERCVCECECVCVYVCEQVKERERERFTRGW